MQQSFRVTLAGNVSSIFSQRTGSLAQLMHVTAAILAQTFADLTSGMADVVFVVFVLVATRVVDLPSWLWET